MTADGIKALIQEHIDRETEGLREARRLGGVNSPGFNQIVGAIDALQQLLSEIEEADPD